MIVGIGTDIVTNQRIEALYEKYEQRFLNKIYTVKEINYALSRKNPIPYLAGRFAVKEAAIKAFHSKKLLGIQWKDISVEGINSGKKELIFYNEALQIIKEMSVSSYHFSLSHSDEFSIAVVFLEKN